MEAYQIRISETNKFMMTYENADWTSKLFSQFSRLWDKIAAHINQNVGVTRVKGNHSRLKVSLFWRECCSSWFRRGLTRQSFVNARRSTSTRFISYMQLIVTVVPWGCLLIEKYGWYYLCNIYKYLPKGTEIFQGGLARLCHRCLIDTGVIISTLSLYRQQITFPQSFNKIIFHRDWIFRKRLIYQMYGASASSCRIGLKATLFHYDLSA